MNRHIRAFDELARQFIYFHRDLVKDPRYKFIGATAALAESVGFVDQVLIDLIGAGETVTRELRKKNGRASHLRRAYTMFENRRRWLLIILKALREESLTWRLRVQQWQRDKPVNSRGEALPLGDQRTEDYLPAWLTGERRTLFRDVRRELLEIEDWRRRYLRAKRQIRATIAPHDDASCTLADDIDGHVRTLDQAAAAAFDYLADLRNADLPDEVATTRVPRAKGDVFARFIQACEPLGRRLDDWLAVHPEKLSA